MGRSGRIASLHGSAFDRPHDGAGVIQLHAHNNSNIQRDTTNDRGNLSNSQFVLTCQHADT